MRPHHRRHRGDLRAAASEGPEWIYGVHPVVAALRHIPQAVRQVFVTDDASGLGEAIWHQAREARVAVQAVDRAFFAEQLPDAVHQGVAAQTAPFAYAPLEQLLALPKPAVLLALDQVQDPRNVGAMVRSAAALGAKGVVLCKDRSAALTAVAIKASAGAAFALPVARVTNLRAALAKAQAAGFWRTGLAADAPDELGALDWQGQHVLVVGGEGRGLRPLTVRSCDRMARIALHAVGSLNAASAAAIALYEATRGLPRQDTTAPTA